MENQKVENLFKVFLKTCDSVLEGAYVVTDGRTVASIVLDHNVADFVLRKCKENQPGNWVICNIPHSIEYAFRSGYMTALKELADKKSGEDAKAAPEEGEFDDGEKA